MAIVPLPVLQQLADCGKYVELLPLLDEYLQQDQGSLPALQLMATCLYHNNRLDDAIAAWQMCLLVDPEPYRAMVSLAETLWDADRTDEALEAVQDAIAGDPTLAEAHASYSLFLCHLERFEDALVSSQTALAYQPSLEKAQLVKARALAYLGRLEESERAYTEALVHQPVFPTASMERGILRYLQGRFADGGPDYEHRWLTDAAPVRISLDCPDWDGEPFDGNLLIYGEQGIGDEIFFLGFLSRLQFVSNPIILAVDSRLVSLLSRSMPDKLVVSRGWSGLASLSVQRTLPIASLPYLLTRSGVQLPFSFNPYLSVPRVQGLTGSVQTESACRRGFRVGLFWRSFRKWLGRSKSLDLSHLDFLADVPGAELVSLQYGDMESELDAFACRTGKKIGIAKFDVIHELDLLACLIASCDCIVSVPGVAAHIAGALGIQTLVLSRSPRGRLWYWQANADQNRWYPSVTVYCDQGDSDTPSFLAMAKDHILKLAQAHEDAVSR